LFHNIRVGVYLYEHSYSEDVVLAGLLHDTLEWSSATENIIKKEFGQAVRDLIMANTKDDRIKNNDEKVTELIQRCAKHGEDALIVKTADILDSFKWYSSQNNEDELQNYCAKNAKAIFKFKPSSFNDKIFKALKSWQVKYAN
jgi:(p)ppGpp synthase/HD superfamily hydrolase